MLNIFLWMQPSWISNQHEKWKLWNGLSNQFRYNWNIVTSGVKPYNPPYPMHSWPVWVQSSVYFLKYVILFIFSYGSTCVLKHVLWWWQFWIFELLIDYSCRFGFNESSSFLEKLYYSLPIGSYATCYSVVAILDDKCKVMTIP